MPFTIGGEWIPESNPTFHRSPIKVFKEKRRSSYVTIIKNLPYNASEIKKLCSSLKQKLGCGGSIKEECIELQGDQIITVKSHLKTLGLRIS